MPLAYQLKFYVLIIGHCMARHTVRHTGEATSTNIIAVMAGNNRGTAVLCGVRYLQSVWGGCTTSIAYIETTVVAG